MKIIVVGRGSMGKRRIRDLTALGHEVNSWDKKDGTELDAKGYDAIVISTPPDHHNEYIKIAVENNIPCFVEASVVLQDLEEINEKAKEKKSLVCPSCTFQFDKYVRKIKQILNDKVIGSPLGFTFHLGQSLLDWHPGQPLEGYYAAQKLTGAAKEMVTFDWTWLFDIFGFPDKVKGCYRKVSDMKCDINDIYAMVLEYPDKVGIMMTDAISKEYIKRLMVMTDQAVMPTDWSLMGIDENMYLEEMQAFIKAVEEKEPFPNTLDKDIKVLKLLEKFENENK